MTRYIIILILIVINNNLFGQNWEWEWAKTVTKEGYYNWLNIQDSDRLNNLYCTRFYNTYLSLPDKSIFNPDQFENKSSHVEIIKFSSRGQNIDSLNLYGTDVFGPIVKTDSFENSYLSCCFSYNINIGDTIFYHNNYSNPFLPDGLIVKFNDQNEIVWATFIQNTLGQYIRDLIVNPNGEIYCLSEQVGSLSTPTTTIFFEQDTIYSDHDFTSITKLDNDKNIIWRKDLHGEISSYDLVQGDDSLFYLIGYTISDVILEQDTLVHPNPVPITNVPFMLILDENGTVGFFDFQEFVVWPRKMLVNENSEKYIAGPFYDTLIIMQDTIVPPTNIFSNFIGKFDASFELIWYQVLSNTNNGYQSYIEMALDDDNLLFMVSSTDDLQVGDTTVSIPNGQEAFIGEFGPDGEILNVINTITSGEFNPTLLILDNCKNPIISGSFKGTSYLGSDTIQSSIASDHDGFIAKIIRNEVPNLYFGSDTIVCEQLTLTLPDEYPYYSVNDSIFYQNDLSINKSGFYVIGCADVDFCWLYDTINIEIHPGFEIELGSDTTIRENDTVVFSILDQYESYLWSNGATSNKITIIGNDYGIDTFPIWVEVTDGPCTETDTLLLTIKSEFGINEFNHSVINIFPNPFTQSFTIEIEPYYQRFEICDLNGHIKLVEEINQPNNKSLQIGTENLNQGIYILTITTNDKKLIIKIIKI